MELTLPHEVNVLKFIQSRAKEIAMATEELFKKHPKLAMQQLPRHLRRRATSHNIRRLPRRLRERAQKEFEAMKVKKTKRPSRRHRRRPRNLLAEYNRRKRKHSWLETHIWFAKRFKMADMWGYKIGLKPNDKGVKAAYRASARHCLMQDISYYCCIELIGPQEAILKGLSRLVHQSTGLTFGAKTFLRGTREGNVMVYSADSYPYDAICPVSFLWKTEEGSDNDTCKTRQLWLWCHPAAHDKLTSELAKVFEIEFCKTEEITTMNVTNTGDNVELQSTKDDLIVKTLQPIEIPTVITSSNVQEETKTPEDKCTLTEDVSNLNQAKLYTGKEVTMILLKDNLVRFRLTGPLAQTCLGAALHMATVEHTSAEGNASSEKWWQQYYRTETAQLAHKKQGQLWDTLKGMHTSEHLLPGLVISLTVRDPRMTLPRIRTKAVPSNANNFDAVGFSCMTSESIISRSPIWETNIRSNVKETKIPESEINQMRYQCHSKGCELSLEVEESRIPILLLHRTGPGQSDYSSGWDVIIPSGWAMAFWVALVYRGGRAAGLQEQRSVALEAGQPVFPFNYPDTQAGQKESDETYTQLATKYHRYPPDKRPSFKKLGIKTPFFCPYKELVKEWITKSNGHGDDDGDTKFFVLRNKRYLKLLQLSCEECVPQKNKGKVPRTWNSCVRSGKSPVQENSLAQLKQLLTSEGSDLQKSVVFVQMECVSKGRPKGFSSVCLPQESDFQLLKFGFGGPKEPIHPVKRERKTKANARGKKRKKTETELQVPLTKPTIFNVTDGCKRDVIGFTEVGEFSFLKAHGTALGYCSTLGLVKLLEDCKTFGAKPAVLLRAQHSLQYRFAHLNIVT